MAVGHINLISIPPARAVDAHSSPPCHTCAASPPLTGWSLNAATKKIALCQAYFGGKKESTSESTSPRKYPNPKQQKSSSDRSVSQFTRLRTLNEDVLKKDADGAIDRRWVNPQKQFVYSNQRSVSQTLDIRVHDEMILNEDVGKKDANVLNDCRRVNPQKQAVYHKNQSGLQTLNFRVHDESTPTEDVFEKDTNMMNDRRWVNPQKQAVYHKNKSVLQTLDFRVHDESTPNKDVVEKDASVMNDLRWVNPQKQAVYQKNQSVLQTLDTRARDDSRKDGAPMQRRAGYLMIEPWRALPRTSENSSPDLFDASHQDDCLGQDRSLWNSGNAQKNEGGSAISRIAEKLRSIKNSGSSIAKLGYQQQPQQQNIQYRVPSPLYVPSVVEPFFPRNDKSWSTPYHPIPTPGSDQVVEEIDCKFPWEKVPEDFSGVNDEFQQQKPVRVKPPSLAELLIPQAELKRLRYLGIQLRKRLKIGRLGVTDGIVAGIHERWRNSELVRVKCEGASAWNMRKIHEDLERKTKGLVIWRSGGAAIVYRGKDYSGPAPKALIDSVLSKEIEEVLSEDEDEDDEKDSNKLNSEQVSQSNPSEKEDEDDDDLDLFARDLEYETEMDKFLEDLGPRYKDWTGRKLPLPVDGDALPAIDERFKPPFRLLPYGVNPKLSNVEMTNLRRLARSLPPHFALGRNRGHQGLASAIVKVWEKCEVAKIAVKRGVQNTSSEIMAEELKRLTGGLLLSRDREFITFYRGKDFLPQALADVLAEREAMTKVLLEQEEKERKDVVVPLEVKVAEEPVINSENILSEESEIQVGSTVLMEGEHIMTPENVSSDVSGVPVGVTTHMKSENLSRHRNGVEMPKYPRDFREIEEQKNKRRLSIAMHRKKKAEEELVKVQMFLKPFDRPVDQEMISDEEKYMFQKVGLKMKASLLVGRRGVFDGIIENMHLHWKHRELVKLIYKGRSRGEIEETAQMLANESGGVLVGIVPTSKGQSIIVYRGKNYQRPEKLRPENLLTKKQAWKRFTENQRRESLERHILNLEKRIDKLEDDIENKPGYEDISEHVDDVLTGVKAHEGRSEVKKVKVKTRYKPLGPIFRADPLTNKEKLILRKQALKLGKPCHFHVGKSNVVAGLIKSIRAYFQVHALVKIGVKGRARGTAVAELVQEIEDGTGAVLVSQEPCKLIFYRGWPEGQEQPSSSVMPQEISPDLIEAVRIESGDYDYVR